MYFIHKTRNLKSVLNAWKNSIGLTLSSKSKIILTNYLNYIIIIYNKNNCFHPRVSKLFWLDSSDGEVNPWSSKKSILSLMILFLWAKRETLRRLHDFDKGYRQRVFSLCKEYSRNKRDTDQSAYNTNLRRLWFS